MSSFKWFFIFIYELLVSLIFSLVGYYRTEESYKKKEEIFKPFKDLFGLKSKPYKKYKPKVHKTFFNRFYSLFVLILLILLARYSLLEPYKIPTGSLIPTLKVGDFLFVNKLAYGLRLPFIGEIKTWAEPKRGEIVTFYPPTSDDMMYVKRLIGEPGDHIQVVDTKLYINGQEIKKTKIPFMPVMSNVKQPEPGKGIPYTKEYFSLYKEDLMGVNHYALQLNDRDILYRKFNVDIIVPEDYYFFMGDNRDNSEDSRVWGLVPRDRIRGRVAVVWMSFNWSKIFQSGFVRWERIFTSPR